MSDGGLRFYIAPNAAKLDPTPSWTQVDSELVSSVDIQRGRQDEFNRTGAGIATVSLNDKAGDFDPTNTGGEFFNSIDGKPARVDLYDPVLASWETVYRGFVDDQQSAVDASERVTKLQVPLVDMFDYLARAQAAPGISGSAPPPGSTGFVFYEDGTVQDHIVEVLTDAGIDPAQQIVFTGNIDVQESLYDPGASYLSIIQDAADAEFPDVANTYVDRLGRFAFHGRFSRFDPEGVAGGATPGAWDFHRWRAGDGAAIASDADTVQIRELAYGRPSEFIYNAALCYPKYLAQRFIPGQVVTDLGSSIADYGVRPWEARDLIVQAGTTSGNNARDECKSFSQYIVDNYAAPRTRIQTLTFKSLRPDDSRAAKNWALLTTTDISDIIELTTTNPGGGGFAGDAHFVEGLHYQITPLNGAYANVILNVNLSPQGYYNTEF